MRNNDLESSHFTVGNCWRTYVQVTPITLYFVLHTLLLKRKCLNCQNSFFLPIFKSYLQTSKHLVQNVYFSPWEWSKYYLSYSFLKWWTFGKTESSSFNSFVVFGCPYSSYYVWVVLNYCFTFLFQGLFIGVMIILQVSGGKSLHLLLFSKDTFFIYLLPLIIFNAW